MIDIETLKEVLERFKKETKTSKKFDDNPCVNEGFNFSVQCVYIASCKSENMGWIFHEAGIPHVICIKKEYEINDKAASKFIEYFYRFIFENRKGICEAFRLARMYLDSVEKKLKLKKTTGPREADKYMIIRRGDKKPKEEEREKFFAEMDEKLQVVQRCSSIGEFLPGETKV